MDTRVLSYSAPTSDDSLLTSPLSDGYFAVPGGPSLSSSLFPSQRRAPATKYTVQNPEDKADPRVLTYRRGPLPPIPGEASSGSAGLDASAPIHAALASKQQDVHDDLRNEVDNLRREIEMIREQRVASVVLTDAPPSYDEEPR